MKRIKLSRPSQGCTYATTAVVSDGLSADNDGAVGDVLAPKAVYELVEFEFEVLRIAGLILSAKKSYMGTLVRRNCANNQ
jgi:hypothetical protein